MTVTCPPLNSYHLRAAVWLYGSVARGDSDSWSDVDVLIVSDYPCCRDNLVRRALPAGTDHAFSPSLYTWAEIDRMCSYGSLFLHHIRLEGRCLLETANGSATLAKLLGQLGPYTRAQRDITAFLATVADVRRSIRAGGSPMFELSVLATVFRHASVLGCYVAGIPTFGRIAPFERLIPSLKDPAATAIELSTLYQFRLHEDGRAPAPYAPSAADVELWCARAERYLQSVEEVVNAYEANFR